MQTSSKKLKEAITSNEALAAFVSAVDSDINTSHGVRELDESDLRRVIQLFEEGFSSVDQFRNVAKVVIYASDFGETHKKLVDVGMGEVFARHCETARRLRGPIQRNFFVALHDFTLPKTDRATLGEQLIVPIVASVGDTEMDVGDRRTACEILIQLFTACPENRSRATEDPAVCDAVKSLVQVMKEVPDFPVQAFITEALWRAFGTLKPVLMDHMKDSGLTEETIQAFNDIKPGKDEFTPGVRRFVTLVNESLAASKNQHVFSIPCGPVVINDHTFHPTFIDFTTARHFTFTAPPLSSDETTDVIIHFDYEKIKAFKISHKQSRVSIQMDEVPEGLEEMYDAEDDDQQIIITLSEDSIKRMKETVIKSIVAARNEYKQRMGMGTPVRTGTPTTPGGTKVSRTSMALDLSMAISPAVPQGEPLATTTTTTATDAAAAAAIPPPPLPLPPVVPLVAPLPPVQSPVPEDVTMDIRIPDEVDEKEAHAKATEQLAGITLDNVMPVDETPSRVPQPPAETPKEKTPAKKEAAKEKEKETKEEEEEVTEVEPPKRTTRSSRGGSTAAAAASTKRGGRGGKKGTAAAKRTTRGSKKGASSEEESAGEEGGEDEEMETEVAVVVTAPPPTTTTKSTPTSARATRASARTAHREEEDTEAAEQQRKKEAEKAEKEAKKEAEKAEKEAKKKKQQEEKEQKKREEEARKKREEEERLAEEEKRMQEELKKKEEKKKKEAEEKARKEKEKEEKERKEREKEEKAAAKAAAAAEKKRKEAEEQERKKKEAEAESARKRKRASEEEEEKEKKPAPSAKRGRRESPARAEPKSTRTPASPASDMDWDIEDAVSAGGAAKSARASMSGRSLLSSEKEKETKGIGAIFGELSEQPAAERKKSITTTPAAPEEPVRPKRLSFETEASRESRRSMSSASMSDEESEIDSVLEKLNTSISKRREGAKRKQKIIQEVRKNTEDRVEALKKQHEKERAALRTRHVQRISKVADDMENVGKKLKFLQDKFISNAQRIESQQREAQEQIVTVKTECKAEYERLAAKDAKDLERLQADVQKDVQKLESQVQKSKKASKEISALLQQTLAALGEDDL